MGSPEREFDIPFLYPCQGPTYKLHFTKLKELFKTKLPVIFSLS